MARTGDCGTWIGADAAELLRQDRLELAVVRDLLVAIRAESIFGSMKRGGSALSGLSWDTAGRINAVAEGDEVGSLSSEEMLALLSDDEELLFDDASVTIAATSNGFEASLDGPQALFSLHHSTTSNAKATGALSAAVMASTLDDLGLERRQPASLCPKPSVTATISPSNDSAQPNKAQLPVRPRKRKHSDTSAKRVRPKAKLEILRREVVHLEKRLRQLRESRGAQTNAVLATDTNTDTDAEASAAADTRGLLLESWELVATRQQKLRAAAEAENARLRAALQTQALVSQQLARALVTYPLEDE